MVSQHGNPHQSIARDNSEKGSATNKVEWTRIFFFSNWQWTKHALFWLNLGFTGRTIDSSGFLTEKIWISASAVPPLRRIREIKAYASKIHVGYLWHNQQYVWVRYQTDGADWKTSFKLHASLNSQQLRLWALSNWRPLLSVEFERDIKAFCSTHTKWQNVFVAHSDGLLWLY